MEGDLSLESNKNEGSQFFFTIPLSFGDPTMLTEEVDKAIQNADLSDLKILVAEDHKVNQYLIKSIFKTWNVEPDIAENGVIAIEMLKKNLYDIVLMDRQMPEMGGVEATKIIREKLKLDIPIIAVTAAALKGSREQALDAGMNDYVTKPFDPEDLLRKIITYVNPKKIKTMVAYVKDDSIKDAPEKMYSLQGMSKMFGNNMDTIKEMIKLFISTTPPIWKDLQKEYKQKNFERVSELAHKLKPSFDIMEIESLKQVIRDIELNSKNNDADKKLKGQIASCNSNLQKVLLQLEDEVKR
jgi:CheY-like chemotaxis protein